MHAMQMLGSMLTEEPNARAITDMHLRNKISHMALVMNVFVSHIHSEYMKTYIHMVITDLIRRLGVLTGDEHHFDDFAERSLPSTIAVSLSIGRGVLYLSVLERDAPARPCVVVSEAGEHLAAATDVTGGEGDGDGPMAVSIAFV